MRPCVKYLCSLRYKYTYMEEMLGNVAGCRQVFERWMEWEPEEQAWHSYINFELRYKEVDKARSIYERYILYAEHRLQAAVNPVKIAMSTCTKCIERL